MVNDVLARHSPSPRVQPAGRTTTLVKAKREMNLREFDKADNLLKNAIESNPKLAEAHYLRGVLHELREEKQAAYRHIGPHSRPIRSSSRPSST